MKSIVTQIFVTLGVIFLIVILFSIYFFITDPFNIKPMLLGSPAPSTQSREVRTTETNTSSETGNETASVTSGFSLSPAQKQALINFGIDPEGVPTTVSAEQEACFVSALGEARVGEVKAGAVPSAYEFFKAKACI